MFKNNKLFSLRKIKNWSMFSLLSISIFLCVGLVLTILSYFLVQGVRYFHFWQITSDYKPLDLPHSGYAAFIVTTIMLLFLTMLIALPLAFGVAVWMSEYAKKSKIRNTLETVFQIWSAIPTLVFGIIGMLIFVLTLRLGYTGFSILSASLTMVLVLIPSLIIGFYHSFKEVSNDLRMNSYSLGATQWHTFWTIVFKKSLGGVRTTVISSISRLLGESAPLLLTLGAAYYMPSDFFSQGRTLVSVIFLEFSNAKPGSTEYVYSVIFFLIFLLLVINIGTKILFYFLGHRNKEKKSILFLIKNKLIKSKDKNNE